MKLLDILERQSLLKIRVNPNRAFSILMFLAIITLATGRFIIASSRTKASNNGINVQLIVNIILILRLKLSDLALGMRRPWIALPG
jgi:hypothetical protein